MASNFIWGIVIVVVAHIPTDIALNIGKGDFARQNPGDTVVFCPLEIGHIIAAGEFPFIHAIPFVIVIMLRCNLPRFEIVVEDITLLEIGQRNTQGIESFGFFFLLLKRIPIHLISRQPMNLLRQTERVCQRLPHRHTQRQSFEVIPIFAFNSARR